MNAYMLGYNEGCADKPALVAAVRAVLDACDRTDASIIPSGGFEVGQKSVTQTIRMVVERKLSTVPSAAESARAIATALGEGPSVSDAIERAARVIQQARDAGAVYDDAGEPLSAAETIARALADAGLLSAEPSNEQAS